MEAIAAVPVPAGAVSVANANAIREESRAYLQSLLNKYLVVHTTDGRMFRGEFKCTDPVCLQVSLLFFLLCPYLDYRICKVHPLTRMHECTNRTVTLC